MSLCPICGRMYCDHTPAQRDQSAAQIPAMREPSPEEVETWRTEPSDSAVKIGVAQKHAHDPVNAHRSA